MPAARTADRSCPACKRTGMARIWPTRGNLAGKAVAWCGHCGFGWLDPQPSRASIENYYKRLPPYILQGINEKELGFRNRVRQLRRLAPQRGRLLDVGAGIGVFLKMARADGWQVSGLDPQHSAAEIARRHFQVNIRVGTLDTVALEPQSFDVVTLWDVLEHVFTPEELLARCKLLVKPDGLLCLSVPNASGVCARLFKGHWRYVMGTHLNYFSNTYAQALLRRSGFPVVHRSTAFKVQSLVQGIITSFNLGLNPERIYRSGRGDSPEQDRPEQNSSASSDHPSTIRRHVLPKLRQAVLRINALPLTTMHGDILDLYCRRDRR